MSAKRLTIIVSGMIAADPWQGGAAWAVLQYVLGFQRLGHRVVLVEPILQKAIDASGGDLAGSENAHYFRRVMADVDIIQYSSLLSVATRQSVGLSFGEVSQIAREADVLINISGMLVEEELTAPIPIRVYLDLDPAFNQLWHAVQNIDMRFSGHTHFVTIGQAIGQEGCSVPSCGLDWITTHQPVGLSHWPMAEKIVHHGLTTIGNWRGYGSIEHQGTFYGQKAHSLRPLVTLPTRTSERFILAMNIHPGETKDLEMLAANRWQLLEPEHVARTPASYQQFIQGSKAEFGIAKSGYVLSRCGWFSDRSVCYLASGRPVIAQDTGFSRYLPTGQGLFAFETADQVLAAIDKLNGNYDLHARAARQIAEDYFDSDLVLSQLLRNIGAI